MQAETTHDSQVDASPPAIPARRRRRIDRGLLLASMIIAVGLTAIIWGLTVGITGDEGLDLPDAIESIEPRPDAVQVLPQTNVIVDLEVGYTGVFVINGVELETINLDQVGSVEIEPGRQVDLPPVTIFEPGNATLTFAPTHGAPVEQFTTGSQEVTVIFWRLDEGRDFASSYTWSFNVL